MRSLCSMFVIGMTSSLRKVLVWNNTPAIGGYNAFSMSCLKRHITYSKVYPYFELEAVTSSDSLKVKFANTEIWGQEKGATRRPGGQLAFPEPVSLTSRVWPHEKRQSSRRQDCNPNRGHDGHLGPNANLCGDNFCLCSAPRRLFPARPLPWATLKTKSLPSVLQAKAKIQATVPLYKLKSGKACSLHTAEYPSNWRSKPSSTSAGARQPHNTAWREHGGPARESWMQSEAVYSNNYIRADRAPPSTGIDAWLGCGLYLLWTGSPYENGALSFCLVWRLRFFFLLNLLNHFCIWLWVSGQRIHFIQLIQASFLFFILFSLHF